MARIEDLTDHDVYRIEQARKADAETGRLDFSDDRAVAHRLGRVEVALKQLLEMLDEGGVA
jgi:hypothetical protein